MSYSCEDSRYDFLIDGLDSFSKYYLTILGASCDSLMKVANTSMNMIMPHHVLPPRFCVAACPKDPKVLFKVTTIPTKG